jgi:hypothetical protein
VTWHQKRVEAGLLREIAAGWLGVQGG